MHRRIGRVGAVTGACLALIAGGFAVGEYRGSHASFEESAGGACGRLTDDGNLDEMNVIAPTAQNFSVRESVLSSRGRYSGYCVVSAGGDEVLSIIVEFMELKSFDAWKQKMGDEWVPSEGRSRLHVAGGGWTGPSDAAVFVPCTLAYPSSIAEDGGLSVTVRTDDDADYQEQVTTIVKRAAKVAASSRGPCEAPTD